MGLIILEKMVNGENNLVLIYKDDFKHISYGYEKLMIGLGKSSDLESLLNLFDLYKDSESLIVQVKGEDLTARHIENILNKIRGFFTKDLNIIYGVDYSNSIYDVAIFLPINYLLDKEYFL